MSAYTLLGLCFTIFADAIVLAALAYFTCRGVRDFLKYAAIGERLERDLRLSREEIERMRHG